jgi:acetyl esterase/lipase
MDTDRRLKPVLFTVPGMEEIVVQRDNVYHQTPETQLVLDVYHPSDIASHTPRPAVLLIHGGPIPFDPQFPPTKWSVFQSYGQLLAATGVIAVTLNHRYSHLTDLAQAADDIHHALTFIRDHAATFSLDPDRLGLWVFSGAGPFLSDFLRIPPTYLRCLVAYYALLDLQPLGAERLQALDPMLVQRFSATEAVSQGAASHLPLFIARAGQDTNAPIDNFIQAALRANMALEVMNHPTGHHGFDILDDDMHTRDIIRRTLTFVQTHLLSITP